MDKHFVLISKGGIKEFPGNKPVYIGETEGSDIRIANHSEYEDEIVAKIEPNGYGNGWHLVSIPPHIQISVNGIPVHRVVYLEDGDVIETLGERWKFSVREGTKEGVTVYHVKRTGFALWMVCIAIIVLGAVVGGLVYSSQRDNISGSMRKEIEASLYTTRVDSLQLVRGDSIVESYAYASEPIGTAFLTTDSLIVTARHCINPWLNTVLPADYGKIDQISDWPVQKALFAETSNQLEGTNDWRIIAYLTLTDEEGREIMMTSDDFRINTEFDDIVELGTYDNPLYWRSIAHRYTRRDMMLGDVAAARTDMAGTIPLADESEIRTLLAESGVKLTFFGHPEAGVTGNRLECKTDELRLPLSELPELPGRVFLLAHEGALAPGFSGGPVIVRDGMGFKAVGVVSVTDDRNGYRSYSVPTSEITLLQK